MKKIFYLSLVVLFPILQCISCGPGKTSTNEHIKDSVVSTLDNFPVGELINKVVCKVDTTQTYSLYLPKSYTHEKKFPIVYVFDPHGDGHLPLNKYKALAEKYGFVLVGSNNSKNGNTWDETLYITSKLFADAGSRISINTSRVFLLGFSGGARIANAITILNGSINSVICCGAVAPATTTVNPRSDYCLLGIVGNTDMNYVEMQRYDLVDIAGHNVKHFLMTFDGKHEWPSETVMDKGFWWLALNDMRKGNIQKDDAGIAEKLTPLLKELESINKAGKTYETYLFGKEIINFYEGLADLKTCYDIYQSVQNTPSLDKALKQEEGYWTMEAKLKQSYLNSIQSQNLQWWKSEIGKLNKNIKAEKDHEEALVYKRTLNFLSLVCYMQTSNALKQKSIPTAEYFAQLYLIVDPENGDAHFLTACVKAAENKEDEALASLATAVKLGYVDKAQLLNEPALATMKTSKKFQDIVNTIPGSQK